MDAVISNVCAKAGVATKQERRIEAAIFLEICSGGKTLRIIAQKRCRRICVYVLDVMERDTGAYKELEVKYPLRGF